ncbi:hypothetical protein LCGC14_0458210 [marine sediment metagenome]|uniref:Uncharacterized protein n=1 Tax=marine sediment metagenome TaxID=412755 RepID=A0A0F9VPW7_9ZZZZ
MGSFKAQHTATRAGAGLESFARLAQSGEIVHHPFLWQQALEGNVYMWGHGLEETAQDTPTAALDNQIIQAALTAPLSGTIVVPLGVTFRMHGDGATGAPDLWLNYTQEDLSILNSGTDASAGILNCLGGPNPKTAKASVQTVTGSITNYTDAQNVLLTRRANMLVDTILTEMAATDTSVEAPGFGFLEGHYVPPVPIFLRGGASINFYSQCGTTAATFTWVMHWVELDEGAYLAGHTV